MVDHTIIYHMEIIKDLDSFDGKRNSALTFIIPPNYEFKRDYNKIKKIHSAIKHDQRRRKLLTVTREIDSHLENIDEFSGNGCIICCGLDKSGATVFHKIDSQIMITDFEYHYGYGFATNAIKKLFFKKYLKTLTDKDEEKVRDNIIKGLENGLTVVGKEINIAKENHLLSTIYYFSEDSISCELIMESLGNGFEIVMMNMSNPYNRDIKKDYGEQIGYLYYGMRVNVFAE